MAENYDNGDKDRRELLKLKQGLVDEKDSNIKVAYTVELDEMLKKLENDSWNPQAETSKNS